MLCMQCRLRDRVGNHRYVTLLYEQPSLMNVSALPAYDSDASTRFNFDIRGWAAARGMSAPLGANFWITHNSTGI